MVLAHWNAGREKPDRRNQTAHCLRIPMLFQFCKKFQFQFYISVAHPYVCLHFSIQNGHKTLAQCLLCIKVLGNIFEKKKKYKFDGSTSSKACNPHWNASSWQKSVFCAIKFITVLVSSVGSQDLLFITYFHSHPCYSNWNHKGARRDTATETGRGKIKVLRTISISKKER